MVSGTVPYVHWSGKGQPYTGERVVALGHKRYPVIVRTGNIRTIVAGGLAAFNRCHPATNS